MRSYSNTIFETLAEHQREIETGAHLIHIVRKLGGLVVRLYWPTVYHSRRDADDTTLSKKTAEMKDLAQATFYTQERRDSQRSDIFAVSITADM